MTTSPVSPLLDALYHGRRDEADRLLTNMDADALTIHEAAAMGVVRRISQLLDAEPSAVNAFAPDGFQPLQLAAFFAQHAAAELLLARGGDVNTTSRNSQGVNALHAALSSADPEFARSLIAAGADVNTPQSSGVTPLHEAAYNGYVELAGLLLARGADVSARDSQGRSALDLARERGQSAMVQLLERV